jgi:hypothetical protein
MRTAALSTAALLLAACSSPLAPRDGIELRTSRAAYAPWDTILISITNRSSDAIYVAHCNFRLSLMLEKRTDDVWTGHRQVNGPLCQAVYPMGETAIAPGAPVTESLLVEESGHFRLTTYVRRAAEDFGSLLIVSRPFIVSFPPD